MSSNVDIPDVIMSEDESLYIDSISKGNVQSQSKEFKWKNEHENILIEWADKAMCYRWLHARSHQKYSSINTWFTIPVIIMSTLTGTANFAQDKIDEKYRPYAQMAIGTVNIFAGILTTIQQFLKVAELNEAHRVSSISWDKFYRNIKIELAKSRQERTGVAHMLKLSKEEFDRLMETSPSINENIIAMFNNKFPKKSFKPEDSQSKHKQYDIIRPEICDSLVSTAEILLVEVESRGQSSVELSRIKQKHDIDKYEKQIVQFIKTFSTKKHRRPLVSEIIDNNNDKITSANIEKVLKMIHYEEIVDDISNVDDMENTVDRTDINNMSMNGSDNNV